MPNHSCEFCNAKKSRRSIVALLERLPNVTNTRAATLLGISRQYIATQRVKLEAVGCVAKRERTGNAQHHIERAMSKAQRLGGHPIAHTLPGEVEEVRAFFRPHPPVLGIGYPIGSMWPGAPRVA